MKFKTNRRLYIRRLIFAVLFVVTAALQHTRGAVPVIGSAHAMLLIPLAVSVAMFEKSVAALFFGAFAGVLWDMAGINADGYFSVALAVVCFLTAVLINFHMRNNFPSACLINSIAALVCNVGYWLFFILLKDYDSPLNLLVSYYLPSAVYTAVLIPIYYFLIRAIADLTKPEKKRVNY